MKIKKSSFVYSESFSGNNGILQSVELQTRNVECVSHSVAENFCVATCNLQTANDRVLIMSLRIEGVS